jgi:8-oxo-dGTP diphosphatase
MSPQAMRHYACAILLQDARILLGLRAPHRKAYANCWDVIGGRVEAGETVAQALHRELGEEIGIAPTGVEELCSVIDHGPLERGEATYHMHLVRSWTGDGLLMVNDEHTELRWFTIAEACALPNLALAEYRDVFRSIPVAA